MLAGRELCNFAALLPVPFGESVPEHFNARADNADRQTINPVAAKDGKFDNAVVDFDVRYFADKKARGSHSCDSRNPHSPRSQVEAAEVAKGLTKCGTVSFDARSQFLEQNDRAPLPVVIGFSDCIVEARHEQIVALDGAAFDQHSGERPEGKDGRVVQAESPSLGILS